MKLFRMLRRFSADVLTVRVQGSQPERFASLCAENGVELARIRPVTGGFTARLPARAYPCLHPLAHQCRVRVHILRKSGLRFYLAWLRHRPGIWLGLALFLGVVSFSNRILWATVYVDVSPRTQELVAEQLAQNGLYAGAQVNRKTLSEVRRTLMDKTDEFGWLSLNYSAGRLVVEQLAASRPGAQPISYDCNLVAAADAVILQTNIKSGFLQRAAGQTVAAGEVLVACSQLDYFKNTVTRRTMGTVIGQVHKFYAVTQPLRVEERVLTGALSEERRLRFWKKTWALPGQKNNEGFVPLRNSRKSLQLLGFALPATLETTLLGERKTQTVILSSTAAEQYARFACICQLYEEFPDAAEVQQAWAVDSGNGEVRCTLTADFCANIAVPEK